jgi:anti-anti-sigma regulatory factor
VLKIQRSANGKVVFTLSGRIEYQDVAELQRILAVEKANRQLVLDLKNVTIVDRDAVKFLSRCEAKGIQLENCPAYIREWMGIERPRELR